MSKLSHRIETLEAVERRYKMLLSKCRIELADFIDCWDNHRETRLPTNTHQQVAIVRNLLKFVEER